MDKFDKAQTYDVILPAGGQIEGDFAKQVGTTNKALIRFGDQTILDHTIQIIRDSGLANRIVVIGTPDVLQSKVEGVEYLPSGPSGPGNILAGLKHLLASDAPPSKVIVLTTDLPFLTSEILQKFVQACPPNKDICVPLITKSAYEARFPGSGCTYVPLKDDTWTAGCAYMIDSNALQKSMPHIERVFENRKSKLGMAKLLGIGFLFKVITKTLTVPVAIKRVEHILQCSAEGVLNCPPELAYDIDATDDYEYAMKHAEKNI